MSRKRDDAQFDLSLPDGRREPVRPTPGAKATVVPFADAATAMARREAIQRVASSGVFALPPNLRPR